ncbi:MAG: ChbG/HpnK family deacetylase [Phycisphaerae bacterium]
MLPPAVIVASPRPRVDSDVAGARRFVILEADDLGLLHAFNEGILAAHRDGSLTSACIRANGFAYRHAIEEVLPQCDGMAVGLHLCLNEAAPVAPPDAVRDLLDAGGNLRGGYTWLMRAARTATGIAQVECELRAQLERVRRDGVRIDHLNSHQHVHMIPPIFRLVCRLASEYGVPAVRLTRELPYSAGGLRKRLTPYVNSNIVKHLLLNSFARANEAAARRFGIATTDYFLGVRHTSAMDIRAVLAGLRAVPYGSIEVLLHPAIGPDPRDDVYPSRSLARYVASPQRRAELASLRSAELVEHMRSRQWTPITYAALCEARNARRPRRVFMPEIPTADRDLCDNLDVSCPPWVSEAQADSRAFAQVLLALTQPGDRVLDVGTGTGILAICLARSGRNVTAVDISSAAVRTAGKNAAHHGVKIACYRSDLLDSVQDRFDLIAFNPPYSFGRDNLATNVAKHLVRRIPWVRRYSGRAMPRTVLRYHQQLLDRLIAQAPTRLTERGALVLHAYETEVEALSAVLPSTARVELARHTGFGNGTVGMVIRL